ncbi:MAG: hypothetical protein KAT48_13020 [Bacteroidales bacterium]|nr:hypothetical protein [Bacteroidales bacterium]
MSNAKSYRQIASFIKTYYKILNAEFSLGWRNPQAYTTVRNIIQGIDQQEIDTRTFLPLH